MSELTKPEEVQDYLLEGLEESLAIEASNGLYNHDFGPLQRYLKESPLCRMHPALLYPLLAMLEGEVSPDGDGLKIGMVKPANSRKLRRRISISEGVRRKRMLAISGFYEVGGENSGCYEAGITRAAERAGISKQRVKQLITPEYRNGISHFIKAPDMRVSAREFSMHLDARVDLCAPALGTVLIIDPERALVVASVL
jgi:hypothetical protein